MISAGGLLGHTRQPVLQVEHVVAAADIEDPVDGLLALAYETDEEGEFSQPVEIRIECLKAAAPFVRPKLQAVVQRNAGDGQSHAEWLKEIRDEIDGEDEEANPKVNGEA